MALILLAEDNEVTAEIIRVRLETAGHEVVWAADGAAALEQLKTLRPQLILLDMMMPEVDGDEVLRQVKGDAVLGAIPIMVVSARAHEEDILSALAAGADDYVTKPISPRELLARVDRALAKGPRPLRVTVRAGDGNVAVGEMADADPKLVKVRFHRDSAPRHAIGEKVELSLTSDSLPEPIELEMRLRGRGEDDQHRVYELAIERRTKHARRMATAFLNLVGGRGSYRLPLFDADTPLAVSVLAQSGEASHELQGVVQDLSIGGARVLMKDDADAVLHRVEDIEVRLQLPDDDEALALTAHIRHRSAVKGGVCYRLRFDPEHSPDFVAQQERISGFIAGRME